MSLPVEYDREWAPIKEACRIFGIGPTRMYDWIGKGFVKSRALKEAGAIRAAVRLIYLQSVRNHLESLPEALEMAQGLKDDLAKKKSAKPAK